MTSKKDKASNGSQISGDSEERFYIPPGLWDAITNFRAHWEVSGKDPIMISGETGVGKSLFLHLSKIFFHEKNPGKPIVKANCAHFSTPRGDLNLVRSELFGHLKGAYTGATRDRVGLVEQAHEGLLVLEEIGELPPEAQALLLIFIETGEYRKLGDNINKKANVKIVGATNREPDLRPDFRFRFFPFLIPSLRERKEDILYYFHAIFPGLVRTLHKSEVLLLLTHHWPGNVREIERVGKLLLRRRWRPGVKDAEWEPGAPGEYSEYGLYHLDPKDSPLPGTLDDLNHELKFFGADTEFLNEILYIYRLSLDDQHPTLAFDKNSLDDDKKFPPIKGIENVYECEDQIGFNSTYDGYLAFCRLFLQDPKKNENILTSLRDCDIDHFSLESLIYPKDARAKVKELVISIMSYLQEFMPGEDIQLSKEPQQFWRESNKIGEMERIKFENQKIEEDEFLRIVHKLSEEDLLKKYYRALLRYAGSQSRVAKISGFSEGGLSEKLKGLDIKWKFEKSKKHL